MTTDVNTTSARTTVLRRRQGEDHVVRRTGETTQHLLEAGEWKAMHKRVADGAFRMRAGLMDGKPFIPTVGIEERPDQRRTLELALGYLDHVVLVFMRDIATPTTRARLVAAARTGKTIFEIQLVTLTGLRAVILAPSAAIVEKTVAEFRAKAPSIPVGAYYGDEKSIVPNGVTVATYQTLAKHAKESKLPAAITGAAIVLCDEGHETMTEYRQGALEAFDPQAVVIAITATPDYNREKTLSTFYPYLIDETRLAEASQKGLLAPGRMRWRPLDVDASDVRLITRKGEMDVVVEEYDPKEMGRVMARAVVFEACRQMRYEERSDHPYLIDKVGTLVSIEHRKLKAMICCPSTDMAQRLLEFLIEHRPAGTPKPVLVLGSTPGEERRRIIADFKRGKIDTLINVRVLLRGFDEPSMKLLIDLSAGVSPVIAEQKFCRPLTRVGDEAGIIAVLYPRGLRPNPILPTAILGPLFTGDDTRDFFDADLFDKQRKTKLVASNTGAQESTDEGPKPKKKLLLKSLRVKNVRVLREYNVVLKPPTFNPEVVDEVRQVLWSSQEFLRCVSPHYGHKPKRPTRMEFREMLFDHASYVGFGETLLRFCKLAPGTINFVRWINKHVPEFGVLENEEPEMSHEPGNDETGGVVEELHPNLDWVEDPNSVAFVGHLDACTVLQRYFTDTDAGGGLLSERQRFVLRERLSGNVLGEIGQLMGLSQERVRQIERTALHQIRTDLRIWPKD
jgi:superfamily II DNA or RNA helicase